MGQDKGSMKIQNKPMIKHVCDTLNYQINEAIIVLNDIERIEKYKKIIDINKYDYKIKFCEDLIKNKGPLSGILTGLEKINNEYALILPCDSPFISKKYIKNIFAEIDKNYQAIVPYHDNNNILKTTEPLHSIYHKNTSNIIKNLINTNKLSIKELIKEINTKFVLIDNEKIEKKEFRNLNSPEDI